MDDVDSSRCFGPIVAEPLQPGGVVPIRPLQNVGSMDGLPFQIDQPNNTDYQLTYDWPNGGRIAQLRITAAFGAGDCSVLINGVPVAGIDGVPIAANTRSQHSASGSNIFVPGDDIVLRINSGSDTLLRIVGTLVITNKSVEARVDPPPFGIVTSFIPMVGPLDGAQLIPVVINPPLRRNPTFLNAFFLKNSPNEDDVDVINLLPNNPGDATTGWTYTLSGPSVTGQILVYSYLL